MANFLTFPDFFAISYLIQLYELKKNNPEKKVRKWGNVIESLINTRKMLPDFLKVLVKFRDSFFILNYFVYL